MYIPPSVIEVFQRALEEDIGHGDITTSLLVPERSNSKAHYIAKTQFVLAGLPFVEEVFRILDSSIVLETLFCDGSVINEGDVFGRLSGRTRSILKGERVSLNILQRLSGIATLTGMYVEKIKGLKAKIADTRKTTPCLRFIEKYAVRVGGGYNHRFGLYDGILIKDNHIAASKGVRKTVRQARKGHHLFSRIEVEVRTLKGLKEAIEEGADIVMLDNMSVNDMREAVEIAKGRVLIEASGNVNLENVRAVAETGVDVISVGALTHSAVAADISLKIVK